MQAHIVLAHPEPKSFNARLARVARTTLEDRGWEVSTSDLYAMGFDPCERAAHYNNPRNPARFDAMAEQSFASRQGTIPAEVQAEIDQLGKADLVILQYPMWWYLPPAILKGWFDRVFVCGTVYSGRQRFETGHFKGKRVMLSVTVATTPQSYAYNGSSADIDLLLWPVHFNLAYVGFDILKPFITYGVETVQDYSPATEIEARLHRSQRNLADRLYRIEEEAPLPFNRLSDYNDEGRLKPGAPVFSPFIRHRKTLRLE